MEREARRALLPFVLALTAVLTTLPGADNGARAAHAAGNGCVFDTQTLWTASGTCRPHAYTYPPNVSNRVQRAIYDASLTFGVPYQVLLRIAMCESSLNPRAAHGGHFGLFQFLPDTFSRGAKQMRQDTGIVAQTYWKAADSSYVAGYLFAVGASPSWGCQ